MGVGGRASLSAQQPKAQLGLAAAGSLGFVGGGGSATHGLEGGEAGLVVDLGWVSSRRLRLVGDAAWFAGSLEEFVPQDDQSYSSLVFDLVETVSLQLMGGSVTSRLVPYASLGLSIHALSSSFGSTPLDNRYNANRFGVTGGVGVRKWIGSSGRQSLFVEFRDLQVTDASRWMMRMGLTRHFAPLTRPN
jgi:hypothetical protein